MLGWGMLDLGRPDLALQGLLVQGLVTKSLLMMSLLLMSPLTSLLSWLPGLRGSEAVGIGARPARSREALVLARRFLAGC
jgi:hypothetical protein